MDVLSMSLDPGGTDERQNWLRRLELKVVFGAVVLITLSIGMFLMNSTSATVSSLIAIQNDAALKLWANLEYFERHHAGADPAEATLPPGLFDSLVEFSRTNASIMKSVHRLGVLTVFSSKSSLDEISEHIRPTDGKATQSDKKPYFDHFGIDPRTNTANVTEQGMYQIELYQAIRDYAQDESSFYKNFLGALSVYLMPVFYALLGAALWTFRSASRRVGASEDAHYSDRNSRFVMAAIAGIAISVIGGLLPNDVLLSPLALAFVFGYSIDLFTSKLDSFIESHLTETAAKADGRAGRP